MTDSELAKYIPKAGDRVSTVAFCRQATLSQKSPSRKESILSRLRQRLSGAEGVLPKKRSSKWAENTNAKRKVRQIEIGWMDFDKEKERYKQVKSTSCIIKARSKFCDYLCTKKKTGQQPPGAEGDQTINQPSVVDLTDNEQNQSGEDLLVENRNSESPNHFGINDGVSRSGNLDLNDTLPWDGLLTVGESGDSDVVFIISGDDRLDVSMDEPNLETEIEIEDDAPHQTVDLSPVLAGEASVPDQALSESQSCPVTLIVRRVKLAIPFLEEVLYGSATSSFKDSFLLYVSQEERSVLLKALEDFETVDTDELLDVLDAHECKQVPTKNTVLPVLAQIGHKVNIQAPMFVIKCWRPVVDSVAGLLPPEGLHHFIAQKKNNCKNSEGAFKLSR
ncbi:hypothetical protein PAMA_000003 [Pampus argenteus]